MSKFNLRAVQQAINDADRAIQKALWMVEDEVERLDKLEAASEKPFTARQINYYNALEELQTVLEDVSENPAVSDAMDTARQTFHHVRPNERA